MYGAAKPVRFHSDRWLQEVRSNGAGSEAGPEAGCLLI